MIWCIALFIIFVALIPAAHATPPPMEYRSKYLLPAFDPPFTNQSMSERFSARDAELPANESMAEYIPYALLLSPYHAFVKISDNQTGDRYISDVWYFNDWAKFSAERDRLFEYLRHHGTVSTMTLDISRELAGTNEIPISTYRTRHINATVFTSNGTSGYFLIFKTDFFPRENYYIAYYGIQGSSDLSSSADIIKYFIMTSFPGFVEYRTYEFDPVSPQATYPESSPYLIPGMIFIGIMGVVIGLWWLILRRR
jgi:hypothetical protein